MNVFEKRKLLEKKIKEYNKIEKLFGTNKKGELLYDEYKDQELALENLELKQEYVGFNDFLLWVEGKTKIELEDELLAIMYDDNSDNSNGSNNSENKEKDIIINPSDEQKAIINCTSEGKYVMVDAVAGSGKTTTVMFIAKHNPKKKILQITYNKQLKMEVRNKVEKAGIDNIDIHTFHSLAVRFYDKECYTDDKIIKVLSKNIQPRTIKKYDIIIIDEVQDMTPNYFSLVCKFINDMKLKDSNILILGDRYQGVYDFKNADTRFLVNSDKIWGNDNNFVRLPMQESYRVTKQIAWFVNKAMLGTDRIISNKKSENKVLYYRKNKFTIHSILAQKILQLLKNGYNPSDIFILAPSLKSSSNKNPLKLLENKLVGMKIPVYFSRNDEDGLDEDIIKGKVAFTSYHQSKGRERKIVIVFGFDSSYFKFYNKDKDPTECPSELYVAITRASELLILFEAEDFDQLEFIKLNHKELISSGMVEFVGSFPKEQKDKIPLCDDIHKTSVSELTSYVSEENNEKLIELLSFVFETTSKPTEKNTTEIPSSIKTKNGKTEDVSDINGLVIPAMFEFKQTTICTLKNIINNMYKTSKGDTKELISKVLAKTSKNATDQFLLMGNLYIALTEKIHSKLSQIDSYDWLTQGMIDICHKNLKKNIKSNPRFEVTLGNTEREDNSHCFVYNTNLYGCIEITARTDCIDDEILWEFKCVGSLQNEHLLQLVVYAWIWEKCMKEEYGEKKFKILNIRTGEVNQLFYKSYYVEEIMSILFSNKYYKKPKDNDMIFIEKCNKIREKIYNSNDKPIEKSLFEFGFENTKDKNQSKKNYFSSQNNKINNSNDSDDELNDNFSFGNMFGKSKIKNEIVVEIINPENNDEKPKKIKKSNTKKENKNK